MSDQDSPTWNIVVVDVDEENYLNFLVRAISLLTDPNSGKEQDSPAKKTIKKGESKNGGSSIHDRDPEILSEHRINRLYP